MTGKHVLTTPDEPRGRMVDPTTVTRVLRHPATAPTAVTVAAIALVVSLGWLDRTGEIGPVPLATPLAEGHGATTEGGATGTTGPVLAARGRRAVLVPNWMDLPLVTRALAERPDAVDTLIPGARPAVTVPTGGPAGSEPAGGDPAGAEPYGADPGDGATAPGAGGATATTGPPVATATTAPPGAVPAPPPGTTPTTAPPVTAAPLPSTGSTAVDPTTTVTVPPAADDPGGLLDVVDDLLGSLSSALEPLPLL